MKLADLSAALATARNAALVVGAGISYDLDIPLEYRLPMQYGAHHPDLLEAHGLMAAWQTAHEADGEEKRQLEAQFVAALVTAFESSLTLQQSVLDWLYDFKAMAGTLSDTHASFAVAWLTRVFNHLITTNWDFVLEWHLDRIYYGDEIDTNGKEENNEEKLPGAYFAPFDPVVYPFADGTHATIQANQLFFQNHLAGGDYFWHPRWDIVAHASDLPNLERWSRPLWKIHGSPFFLACSQCGGFSRWKRKAHLKAGDPCPEHPTERLQPEIIFWGQGIDQVQPQVWRRVRGRLQRSDLIVACGFSGAGSDRYLRHVIEAHPNAWLVNPDAGAWTLSRVHHVKAPAAELATMLRQDLLPG